MFVFLVQVAVIASTVYSYQLGEPGLHFDEHGEYAATYDDYKPRDYQFGYEVSDPHTGDHKSHWEIRENGVVRGSYSLLEPDGTTRVVDYIADKHGFRAVVKKIGTAIHPEPVEHHGIGYGEGIQTHAEPIILQQEVEPIYHSSYDGRIDNYGNDYLLPEKYLNILERVETPHKIEPTIEIADTPIYSIPEKIEVIQQPTIEISHTPVYSSPEVSHVGLLESGHVGLAQPQQIVVQPQIPQAVSVIKQPILTKLSEWYRKWARPYAKGIAVAPVLAKAPETNQKWSYGSGQNENTAIWAKQPEIYQKWAVPYKPVEITKWAEVPEPAVKWEGQGEAEVVLTKIPEVYQKWAVPYGVGNGEVEKWSAPYGGEAKSVHLETKIEPHVEESSQIHGLTGNLEDDSKYKNYGEGSYGGGWKTRLPYEYVINHPVLK